MGSNCKPMALSLLSNATTAIITYAYPAMQTIRVVKERPADPDETLQWVMYWVVVAAMYLLDSAFSSIGALDYLPLWNEIKLVFFLWLMLPTFQGALWIYIKFVKPIVSK